MGHEEVETVLPEGFVPTPDEKPATPSKSASKSSSAPVKSSAPAKATKSTTKENDAHTPKTQKQGAKKEQQQQRSGSRSRMMGRIRGTWRSHRSRSRSRGRAAGEEESVGSSSKGVNSGKSGGSRSKRFSGRMMSIPGIRKSDSNATELKDNTTKAREAKKEEQQTADKSAPGGNTTAEEKKGEESVGFPSQGLIRPMTPVREGAVSPTDTTVTATSFDTDNNNNNNKQNATLDDDSALATAPSRQDILDSMVSIEVGDENEQFEVPIAKQEVEEEVQLARSPSTASATGSVRSNKSTTSVRSNKSTMSSRSTKSTKSVKSARASPAPVEETALVPITQEEEKKEEEAHQQPSEDTTTTNEQQESALMERSASPQNNATWVKQVSLSIGGYKTSFQISDPMTNLAETVNDALNIGISDEALLGEAKALDDIGDKVEEERDYDEQPTKLFMYLQQRAWGLALAQLEHNPEDAAVWVYRKVGPQKAPNVKDGYKSEALVVSHQALVVHDGNRAMEKLRWKLLPLHASIVLGAPPEVIFELIKAYPKAATKPDERGSLPVHLAASRLDVDPEGEKVMLQLFGAYPDSIEVKDKKGRTPPELAKLARMRKEAEDTRRRNVYKQDEAGIEKTASQFKEEEEQSESEPEDASATTAEEEEDDRSVMSSMSARLRRLMTSKSSDTADVRRKKKKKKKTKSIPALPKSKSADDENAPVPEEMGPGFAILRTSSYTDQRIMAEVAKSASMEEEIKRTSSDLSMGYKTPEQAPGSSAHASLIPLPNTFDEDDKSVGSARSTRSNRSTRSTKSAKAPAPTRVAEQIAKSRSAVSPQDQSGPQPDTKAEPESDPQLEAESEPQPEPWNEGLRVLLEKAAENAGRSEEDVTEHLKTLAEEWVTDVEALRRLDGETLDDLLPLILSREVQRLTNLSEGIDNKFLAEESNRGRSPRKKKTKKRVPRRMRKKSVRPRQPSRAESPSELNPIQEEASDDELSIATEAKTVCSRANSTVRIQEKPQVTTYKDPEEADADGDEEPSDFDNELNIRKIHAQLIADARKKFPTRESLEDAIRARQAEVEAAVNSGFDIDKETLSRAALADDEVRKLLPLRLILPTAADLSEMIEVLQVHKESALHNLNMKKAAKIQAEIDELQGQINEEERFQLKKRMSNAVCVTCGESFPQKKRMVGILKTNEDQCQACKENVSSGLSVCSEEGEHSVTGSEKTVKVMNISVPMKKVEEEVDGRDDNNSVKHEN